ncbi:MAG: hypothetical protein P1R58_02970 [bacterium]|nr:hypothetical protein [bacterium]
MTALDPGVCYPACPVTSHFSVSYSGPPPQFTSGCQSYIPVLEPVAEVQLFCDNSGCGQIEYGIVSGTPALEGIHIESATGLLSCFRDSIQADTLYDITVSVTDGIGSDTCYVWFMKGTCQLPGNINHLSDVNISDMVYLVGYLFDGGFPPPSFEEGDVNGSGFIDISDLTYFVEFMFGGGPAPMPCP